MGYGNHKDPGFGWNHPQDGYESFHTEDASTNPVIVKDGPGTLIAYIGGDSVGDVVFKDVREVADFAAAP
jgi:hypothetical protein